MPYITIYSMIFLLDIKDDACALCEQICNCIYKNIFRVAFESIANCTLKNIYLIIKYSTRNIVITHVNTCLIFSKFNVTKYIYIYNNDCSC